MPPHVSDIVARHYSVPGLLETILGAVAEAGGDPERLSIEMLAPVDEFHTAGRGATVQALAMMPLEEGMHVLDAGCGIGGTARCLAVEHGCEVTGVDLTPAFVETARELTRRMGLDGRCRFQAGDATALDFGDGSFDAAVTMHAAMNIAGRGRFYGELHRVLRPGAPLCVFDVMRGSQPGLAYPVPWAADERTSFLKSRDETVRLLEDAGFSMVAERNLREFARTFLDKAFAAIAEADGPPPIGLHLLTGPDGREKFANYRAGLEANQIEPVILVACKAG